MGWGFWIGIRDWGRDGGLRLLIGIEDGDKKLGSGLGIMIEDWGLGIGIADWDCGLGLGIVSDIEIGDWDGGCRIRICDWESGLGVLGLGNRIRE